MFGGEKKKKPVKGYEFLEKIGKGKFGIVYKAKRISDGHYFAIKQQSSMLDSEQISFIHEVELIKKMDQCPYVLKIEDSFSKGGSFYIVSELCAKGTLKDMYEYHLKECSYVPEDEAWRILSQILQAFLFIHGEKVLHRDMKPENVFLAEGNTIKVGDFGLSEQLKQDDQYLKGEQGTWLYKGPEILQKKGFSWRSDIYAIGLTIHELLTRALPFRGNIMQILEQIKNQSLYIEINSNKYSQDLRNVVSSMISMDYRERPHVQQLLDHEKIRKFITAGSEEWLNHAKNNLKLDLQYEGIIHHVIGGRSHIILSDEPHQDSNSLTSSSKTAEQNELSSQNQSSYSKQIQTIKLTQITEKTQTTDSSNDQSYYHESLNVEIEEGGQGSGKDYIKRLIVPDIINEKITILLNPMIAV